MKEALSDGPADNPADRDVKTEATEDKLEQDTKQQGHWIPQNQAAVRNIGNRRMAMSQQFVILDEEDGDEFYQQCYLCSCMRKWQ